MEKHCTKKQIIKLALAGKAESDRHLASCAACAEKARRTALLLEASDNSRISPPDELHGRVMKTYDRLHSGKTAGARAFFPGILRPALALAASALIISAYFILDRQSPEGMYAGKFSGQVLINGQTPSGPEVKGSFASLSTGPDSGASLYHGSLFNISLGPDTSLEISGALISGEGVNLDFLLRRGSVTSVFPHDGVKKTYSFRTPHLLVRSLGTEFVLRASEKSTSVKMIQGTLALTSLATGEEIRAHENSEYLAGADGIVNIPPGPEARPQSPPEKKAVPQTAKPAVEKTAENENADRAKKEKAAVKQEITHEIKSNKDPVREKSLFKNPRSQSRESGHEEKKGGKVNKKGRP